MEFFEKKGNTCILNLEYHFPCKNVFFIIIIF